MTSPLDNLAGTSGSLRKESPDAEEYAGLIRSATVRLVDAENTDNCVERRFDLAYNAAQRCAPTPDYGTRTNFTFLIRDSVASNPVPLPWATSN
jgi:hypothetical protein